MLRAYYGKSIADFIQEDNLNILGTLAKNHGYQTLEKSQQNAWERQITILKSQLAELTGYIYFEFSIPRMGKRVDNIVILGDKIFLLEFKIGSEQYDKHAIDQVIDYALDLRNFHEGSHYANLIPVLIAEKAPIFENNFQRAENLEQAILLNAQNLNKFFKYYDSNSLMDVAAWEQSSYKPTPTIIEAAQALYQNHDVAEITRSDAGAKNLSATANCISNIIEQAKQGNKKAICFPACESNLLAGNPILTHKKVVVDGNIITSRSAGTAIDFALEIISQLLGNEKSKEISKEIVY